MVLFHLRVVCLTAFLEVVLGTVPEGYTLECGDVDDRFPVEGVPGRAAAGSNEYAYDASGYEEDQYSGPPDSEYEETDAYFDMDQVGPKSPHGSRSAEATGGAEHNNNQFVISDELLEEVEEVPMPKSLFYLIDTSSIGMGADSEQPGEPVLSGGEVATTATNRTETVLPMTESGTMLPATAPNEASRFSVTVPTPSESEPATTGQLRTEPNGGTKQSTADGEVASEITVSQDPPATNSNDVPSPTTRSFEVVNQTQNQVTTGIQRIGSVGTTEQATIPLLAETSSSQTVGDSETYASAGDQVLASQEEVTDEELNPRSGRYHYVSDFNGCLLQPSPCSPGDDCHWIGNAVKCVARAPAVVNIRFCGSQCLNRGICHQEVNGYRCECQRGFSGRHCEVFNACIPNPCRGDCECVASCRHEMGYYCHSNGGFTGKNCSIRTPRVRCGKNGIVVDVSKEFLEDFDRDVGNSYIYVSPAIVDQNKRSSACQARDTGTTLQVQIPLPFDSCGTARGRSSGGDGELIRNRLWMDRSNSVFSMPVPIADFECRYEREYTLVSSLTPVVEKPNILRREGRFTPQIQLCKIASCPSACPPGHTVSKGAAYTVGEMIHLIVTGASANAAFGLVTAVERLSMSCDSNREVSGDLILLQNSCQTASRLFVRADVGRRACVSFQAPRSLSCAIVYLHVHIRMCQSSGVQMCPGSGSPRKCPLGGIRRRRTVEGGSVTVVGPLLLLKGSLGRDTVKLFPKTDPPSSAHAYDETVTVTEERRDGVSENRPSVPEKNRLPEQVGFGYLKVAAVVIVCLCAALFLSLLFISYAPGSCGLCSNG